MNRRASSTERVQGAQERPESPLCTSWAPFLWFYPSFPRVNPAPHCHGSLGSFSKPRLGWGLCFLKGRDVLISLGSELLAQPWSKWHSCPAAFRKSCLLTICRPETEPSLLGLQPKYCLFSWCVVQYLQACAQLGYLCRRSADSIPCHMKPEKNIYG